MKNSRIKIGLLSVLIILFGLILLAAWEMNRYPTIIEAVEYKDAAALSENREDYNIVRIQGASGIFYQVLTADGTWEDVWLSGGFDFKLSGVINFPGNKRLIKGRLEELSGEEQLPMEQGDCKYALTVESCEMIAPIKRDYSDVKHGRIIYPKNRIDEYDRYHGDYSENIDR